MICERKVSKIIIKKPNHFILFIAFFIFYDINIMSKFDYEITLTMCLQILNIDGFHFSIIYPAEEFQLSIVASLSACAIRQGTSIQSCFFIVRAVKQCGTALAGSPDLLSGSHTCTNFFMASLIAC